MSILDSLMDIASSEYFFCTGSLESTMTHFTKIATGLTGLAALAAVSSPAGAQMNPYGYGTNGGAVGAIINAVTGYGQYPQGKGRLSTLAGDHHGTSILARPQAGVSADGSRCDQLRGPSGAL
jgi:hypothetical protein